MGVESLSAFLMRPLGPTLMPLFVINVAFQPLFISLQCDTGTTQHRCPTLGHRHRARLLALSASIFLTNRLGGAASSTESR